jgi:hypothetical protein
MLMARANSAYWNPILETLPKERLRALQLKKFTRIFEWTYTNSPFYRQLYQSAGIESGNLVIGYRTASTQVDGSLYFVEGQFERNGHECGRERLEKGGT